MDKSLIAIWGLIGVCALIVHVGYPTAQVLAGCGI